MSKTQIETEKNRALSSDAMWSGDSKFSMIVIPLLIVIIIALLVGLGWFFMQDKNSKQELKDLKTELDSSKQSLQTNVDDMQKKIDELAKATEEKKKAEEAKAAAEKAENEKGFIEGSLSYPSSYIPKDMKVCAVNLSTKKEYCTSDQLYDKKYTYSVGYKIEVPAGKYNVYSSVPSQKDYKAYYSKFVTCGQNANCTSHDPLEVTVEKDKVTEKIDPIDWYSK